MARTVKIGELSHMVIISKLLIAIVFIFTMIASAPISAADGYNIGGNFYSKTDLVADFSRVAISSSGWLDDAPDFSGVYPRYDGDLGGLKSMQPLLYEYIARTKGYPVPAALVKWNKSITIGIGWPATEILDNDGNIVTRYGSGLDPWGQGSRQVPPVFKKQVTSLLAELSELTGLPVEFIEEERADIRTQARIRIIPTTLQNSRLNIENMDAYTIEPYFKAGVPFTPFEFGQVDGYVLPNSDNSIGFAVCRIDPSQSENVIRVLIKECLVRSVGLTGLSTLGADSVLAHWNKSADDYIRVYLQKKKSGKSVGQYKAPSPDVSRLSDGFNSYDRFMISLLYCKQLTAGENIYKIQETLFLSDTCFNSAVQEKE